MSIRKPDVRLLLLRVSGLLALFILFYGLLFYHSDYLELISQWIAENAGIPGVFLYSLIVDALIMPASVDLILPFIMSFEPWIILFYICIASVGGGCCGYLIGRCLNQYRIVQRLTGAYRERGERLLKNYGFWAVVLAAVSPVPFSTVSWIAGILRLPAWKYICGALFRIPRIVGAYMLIRYGIESFTALFIAIAQFEGWPPAGLLFGRSIDTLVVGISF